MTSYSVKPRVSSADMADVVTVTSGQDQSQTIPAVSSELLNYGMNSLHNDS